MKRSLRIVFMGTPEFAAASLQQLIHEGLDIVGVITSPDKPAGRGKKLKASAVKLLASSNGLKVLQPVNLKDPAFLEEYKSLNANLGVVVAFRMLPEVVWTIPEFGTFNLHASLLPNYRGAAPINHAIMNGETETGVTTFFLKHEIDTGDIIFNEKIQIGKDETFGELHDRLMVSGADLVLKTVSAVQNNALSPVSQSELMLFEQSNLKNAPKIYKEDCRIDWSADVAVVYNKIRGLSPYPAAYTTLSDTKGNDYLIKIYKADFSLSKHPEKPHLLQTDGKSTLSVSCNDGVIKILELQVSGKKRMDIRSFLNGFPLSNDWKVM
ncbi:MAG: methionyl-tRNA formyltransferase [Bacteroidales bacterium]|nr:methionyl-tRNA formyltransferase [Bacteroidales bacterium]